MKQYKIYTTEFKEKQNTTQIKSLITVFKIHIRWKKVQGREKATGVTGEIII